LKGKAPRLWGYVLVSRVHFSLPDSTGDTIESEASHQLQLRGGIVPELLFIVPIVIVGLYILSSIKILSEYERGVIFRLGRLLDQAKGPGVILVFGPIDRIVRIDMRQQALEVPPQDIITRDNVTLKVNAAVCPNHFAVGVGRS
jgi:hypothetical protein